MRLTGKSQRDMSNSVFGYPHSQPSDTLTEVGSYATTKDAQKMPSIGKKSKLPSRTQSVDLAILPKLPKTTSKGKK